MPAKSLAYAQGKGVGELSHIATPGSGLCPGRAVLPVGFSWGLRHGNTLIGQRDIYFFAFQSASETTQRNPTEVLRPSIARIVHR